MVAPDVQGLCIAVSAVLILSPVTSLAALPDRSTC
jgi:hypothetical protein